MFQSGKTFEYLKINNIILLVPRNIRKSKSHIKVDSRALKQKVKLYQRTKRITPLQCCVIVKLTIIACKGLRQRLSNGTAGTANNNLLMVFLKLTYQNWIQ